jgi:hypothetical protein
MRRPLLDLTALAATLDLGLTGPQLAGAAAGQGGAGGAPALQRHPAFGLEQRGVWHALTLSGTQQLLGPLRLRADARWVRPPASRRAGMDGGLAGRLTAWPAGQAASWPPGARRGPQLPRSPPPPRRCPPLPLPRRFALDSEVPFSAAQLRGGQALPSLARHLRGVRPQLVDCAWGLDMVVPGSMGAARVVGWYAPARGEGMLELRLF